MMIDGLSQARIYNMGEAPSNRVALHPCVHVLHELHGLHAVHAVHDKSGKIHGN